MKVLCIGPFDKFSRFYLAIKKELSFYEIFRIYSLNISGFLYLLIRMEFSCLIPFKVWFSVFKNKKKYLEVIKHEKSYKSINYKDLIKFHTKLNYSISRTDLLLQALAYIDFFEKTYIKINPDIIILIGDSRLSIETAALLAKKHHIKVYYIEQGPFNTTIFDSKGVNANASIREFEIKDNALISAEHKKDINDFIERDKFPKYKRSPIYRGLDFMFDSLLSKSYIYPPDLRYTDTFPSINFPKVSKSNFVIKADAKNKIYLLILQIPMDVNMIYHSPFFNNHISIVKTIHQNLPDKSRLILREHPLYRGKYEKALYSYCSKNHILIDTTSSLRNSLIIADVVVVNNSTVGIEAISLKKPVVVLGNSYYDNPKICIKYQQKDDLKLLLEKALKFKPKEENINAFLQEFLFNYLIQGFITDKELIAAKIISNKIIQKTLN